MLTLIASFIFVSLIFFMLLALWLGAPLVPTKPTVAKRMIDLLALKPGQKLFDLGSGDGRLLILASKKGIKATGIEINPYVWLLSQIVVFLSGTSSLVKIILGNYWNTKLVDVDGIVVYGLPSIMGKLSKKLKTELKPGTKIISNSFQIPNLKFLKEAVVSGTRIYLYRV